MLIYLALFLRCMDGDVARMLVSCAVHDVLCRGRVVDASLETITKGLAGLEKELEGVSVPESSRFSVPVDGLSYCIGTSTHHHANFRAVALLRNKNVPVRPRQKPLEAVV